MAFQTTEERSQALLERRVAEARTRGAMSPDEEALAIFESIALNLLLEPRTVLYFAFLAKNKLLQVVNGEIAELNSLESAIRDLLNPDYAVRSKTELQNARTALNQLSELDRIQPSSPQFKRFTASVSSFLNKTISKAVRKPGATSLTRPGSEAKVDMGTSLSNLLALHSEFNDRLFSLHFGVSNFLKSPLSTIIGMRTVSRVKEDIDSLISSIDANGSIPANRDLAIQMITNTAAVKSMAELPDFSDAVLSTQKKLPTNYVVRGVSDPASASTTGTAGPFVLPANVDMTVTVNGTSLGPFKFPQKGFDLNNKAAVFAAAQTYPVTIPASYFLFFTLTYNTDQEISFKIPLTSGSRTLSQIVTELNTKFAANTALNGTMHAAEFIDSGSARLMLYHDTRTRLRIASTHVGIPTDTVSGGSAVLYDGSVYKNSAHTILGFEEGAVGVKGTTSPIAIVDSLNFQFGSLAQFSVTSENKITVRTNATSPGTRLLISCPALGLDGDFLASSNQVRLVGTVTEIPTDPVNPIPLVDIGDIFTSPTGSSSIAAVSASRITLSSPVPTFDGDITVTSNLYLAYEALSTVIKSFVSDWLNTEFVKGLSGLESAMSSLSTSVQQSQRGAALDFINRLRSKLQSISSALSSFELPASSGQTERAVAAGILESLTERKFDRAIDLFIKCDIQEALDCTGMTASYGGAFLDASSQFAQNNMVIQNRAQDEGIESTSSQEVKGL